MDPKKWGKYYWGMIYCIIINYPNNPTDEDKKRIIEFFELLKSLLPCENCTHHYKKYLIMYPLNDAVLSSREKLLAWVININNEINKRLGKSQYTTEEILNYYTKSDKTIYENNKKLITMILLIMLIILLICYIKFK